MFNHIFNSQTKTVTFAAFLLAVSGLISRLLGLFRDRLLAGRFGAGQELDIYFAAFRIPDFVYGVVIVGGITAAFLPVFSEYFEKSPKIAVELTNNVLNCFLILLILVCGFLAIFTPFIIDFIAPGFSAQSKVLTVTLTRIMFLSPIFFGLSSIFSGILQYFNRFLTYAIAPILYNLGIIFGILFLVPIFGVFGLAYGVILGSFLHLLVQIPAAKISGFKYRAVFNFHYPGLKKIFKLMIPRTIATAATNLNLIIITAIASTLTVGSITIFNFSNNLQYVPVGLIGIPFAISSFPVLSRNWANGKKEKFFKNLSSTIGQTLYFIIPISFLIFLLRAQIVRLILGTGQFGWWETRLTAASLGLFCFGIFANSLVPLVSRAFFAVHDTKTPALIGVASIGANIILSLLFTFWLKSENIFQVFFANVLSLGDVGDIEIIGLPLALSLAVLIQLFLLLIFLYQKIGDFNLKSILVSLAKILLATLLMLIFSYLVRQIIANFVNMQTFLGIFIQTFVSGLVGILVYFFVTLLLKSPEIKDLKLAILKQFAKTAYDESEIT